MPEINSREQWNSFILQNGGSFLQSWEWGEFQKQFGRRVFRFSNCHPVRPGRNAGSNQQTPDQVRGDETYWQAQIIEMNLLFGECYWYCPGGPVMSGGKWALDHSKESGFMRNIGKEAFKSRIVFLRIEPFCEETQEMTHLLKGKKFRRSDHDINPAQTLILDISRTEEEVLAQMHHKWRYNIHLAEKKNIAVKMVKSQDADFEKYFEDFYSLMAKMSARQGIKSHAKEYYKKQLQISGGMETALFLAEYENKVIAANIVVFFGNQATYLHGAADLEFKNLMAPHLLQWEQIKEAKKRGMVKYDFWGIANDRTIDKKRRVSWEGFTRFKKGFGGEEKNFMGVWDLAAKKGWYGIYKLAQKMRK